MKYKKICLAIVLMTNTLLIPFSAMGQEKLNTDQRTVLHLSRSEKSDFLHQMRQMLRSIQGIVSGIGENDRQKIIRYAQNSGNRMARSTPASVRKKLPEQFKSIGGPTHMMFEELVVRAETDDMETLTAFTGKLMNQCLTCHHTFRISTTK